MSRPWRPAAVALALGFALACLVTQLAMPAANAAFTGFGLKSLSASASTDEAGAHPDVTISFEMNTDPSSSVDPTGLRSPYARIRGAVTELPPGLIGDPRAVPQCTTEEFASFALGGPGCPVDSQVGLVTLGVYGLNGRLHEPIFNLAPANERTVARLGFYSATLPFYVNVGVRPGDYGLVARIDGPPSTPVVRGDFELWGVPTASTHDTKRLTPKEAFPEFKSESPPRPSLLDPASFMTNPTSCLGPQPFAMRVWSYQEPTRVSSLGADFPAITNCEDLEFDPTISIASTTQKAGTPSGLDALLSLRQNEGWNERATSHLRDAEVVLPVGMRISPAAAQGLSGCSPEQVHVGEEVAAECPDSSKIGTAEFDVPVLARPLQGSIYQRSPEPGHLFQVWLVTDDLGVHVKISGEIHADRSTGQLTSLFLDNPQVPLRELKLHFKSGNQGVLLTPPSCATHQASFRLDPWSGGSAVEGTIPMTIDEACEGGGFSPRLTAGTENPVAGSYSPLVFRLTQGDREENILSLNAELPTGLLANLRGVTVCPEDLVAAGGCTEASRVGMIKAAVGGGPTPLWIPQPGKSPTAVYLAGPYKGAPLSLLTAVPAEAGPFDLGTVLTRAALYVDPSNAQVTVKSDPLPQILEGVPIEYRTISIQMDRPAFTLNPTNCDVKQIRSSVASVSGATASLAERFQVGACDQLSFKPKLKLSLKGGTKRTANPALFATLRMPNGGANIAWTRVALPPSVQIDNAHINNPCTRVQFDANSCPKKSILGTAKATTPLLDQPLEGPIYFRSNGGERELPDLVADLHGQIDVTLVGFIDAKRGRIRSTFATVPDAPVSRFQIRLFGRSRGLLENNRNLCSGRNRAIAQFSGQNGRTSDTHLPVSVPCGRRARPQ